LVPAVTRFSTGDKLANRYRILRFIARGGMGEVYEAEDQILGTRVAVKTVAATISDDPTATRRLKQEVNLARRITHPNVCRIFDLGVHQPGPERPGPGVLFITMELVAGASLAQRVRDDGRLTTAEALPIIQAMVDAVGAAHRAGVVHRDLKTDNVLLAPGEGGGTRVVVMDFGLARRVSLSADSSIGGRSIEGTLAYMAPEQLVGKGVGPAADIYALGVVIFEVLTGQLPFQTEDVMAGALKRLTEPAPTMRSRVPDLDPRWDEVVARCLEREVDDRPTSIDWVGRALSGETAGEVAVAHPANPALGDHAGSRRTAPASTAEPTRTRRFWWAAGALGLGLGGLLLASAMIRPVGSRGGDSQRGSSAGPRLQEEAAALGAAPASAARATSPAADPTGATTVTTPAAVANGTVAADQEPSAANRGNGDPVAVPDAHADVGDVGKEGALTGAASKRAPVRSAATRHHSTRPGLARRTAPPERAARGGAGPDSAVVIPVDRTPTEEASAAGARPRRSTDVDDGFILK
ncbi:MAG: protein kinase, partial [Myxococcales bacterium]